MKNEKGFLGFGASGFSGENEEIKEHPHWKYKPYWVNGQVKYELHMLPNQPMKIEEDPGPVPELVRHNAVRQESSSGTVDPSTSITTDRQAQAQDRQAHGIGQAGTGTGI